jgi:hypothetical protein
MRKEAATLLASSIFIGTFFDGKLIGFAKLTTDQTQTQAGVIHILSMVKHRDKAPTNALIAQAVRSCAERGIAHLVCLNFTYGAKPRDSLSDFKVCNGFQRIDLPRYYIPLTGIGHHAFRLGLRHSFLDLVPEPVLTEFREFRSALYNRRFQSLTTHS